jgi:hypothetical protein
MITLPGVREAQRGLRGVFRGVSAAILPFAWMFPGVDRVLAVTRLLQNSVLLV